MTRLHGLDALRGIAALIVAASHFKMLVLDAGTIPGAQLAVDFFFMLSGYIMARTYEGRMPNPPAFLLKRFMRLWPAYLVGLAIGVGMGLAPLYFLPPALLFLPMPGDMFRFNPPSWSLFYELVANLLHSALFARLKTFHLLLLVAVLVLPWTYYGSNGFSAAAIWSAAPEALSRVMVAYIVGIIIWRKLGDSFTLHPAIGLIAIPLAVMVPRHLWPLAVITIFPAAILSALALPQRKPLILLGRISYPLYIVHFPVMLLPFHWAIVLALVVAATAFATWVDASRSKLWALAKEHRRPFARRSVGGREVDRGLPAGE